MSCGVLNGTLFHSLVLQGDFNLYGTNAGRHGRGTQWYANGDIYSGEWDHDVREGQGALTVSADNIPPMLSASEMV